jgi:hypothetical protein
LSLTTGAALSHGVRLAEAFLDGYHAGLAVTIVLVVVGVVISYVTLRRLPAVAPSLAPVTAEGLVPGAEAGPAAGTAAANGLAAGPELAARHSPRLTRLAASACQPGPGRALSIHQVAPAAT